MNSAMMQNWNDTFEAWKSYIEARNNLFLKYANELEVLIRHGYSTKANDEIHLRYFALDVLKHSSDEQKIQFLPLLISDVSSPKYSTIAREIILSLPQNYLMENIERESEFVLKNDDFLDWVNILSLFEDIHPVIAVRLAKRMVNHSNADLIEWGNEYLTEKNIS
ncbi:MAG: hypothetical protein AAF902_17810 [Chloroflexota bacterium]